jgi:hypothetical protein
MSVTTTTFTTVIAEKIVNARRVGSTARESAASAAVPWQTVKQWLQRGRRFNRGERESIGDETYAAFAQAFDEAPGVFMTTLRAHRAAGVAKDPRLAHDIIRHEETKVLRNEELRLLKARADVEENRAAGTHVDRVAVETPKTREELIAEARRLAAEIEADATKH